MRVSPTTIGRGPAAGTRFPRVLHVIWLPNSGLRPKGVLKLTTEDPALLHTILPGGRAIRAEVVYAVRYEMASTIEDVLARRIGMQFYSWSDCIEATPVVGSLMQKELKWSSGYTRDAMRNYLEKIYHLMDAAGLSSKRDPSSLSGQPAAD